MAIHLPVKRPAGPILIIAASLLLVAGSVWLAVGGRGPASLPPSAAADSQTPGESE